jgi:Rps23 Pro-64 3,4-dihydroxylase Tpa1-like proline 4-hydroxylase
MDPRSGFIALEDARDLGKTLNEEYESGNPYPHIVIENFLPTEIAQRCVREFDTSRHDGQIVYNKEHERLKREYKPDELSHDVRGFFYVFNSRPFITIVENITGIDGLIPDPYFLGGGFHEIHNGGHLAIHADFNHHKPMNLERRVNLLIYLNEGWKDEYGGQLELWSNDMKECVQSIVPIFNRAVIFNTTSQSNHGNPQKVNHPNKISRKSIALYYYTATWDDAKRSHTTQFRKRANSLDKVNWSVRIQEAYADIMPPILRRCLGKVKRSLIDVGNR